MSDFYTVKELAKKAGLTPARITDLCRRGEINAQKPGRDWLIEKSDGDRWLRSRKNK